MPVVQLPIVKMNRKRYFVDERLGQLRNVENPHDIVPLDEAFVRVRMVGSYVVPNDPDTVRQAKEALAEDITSAVQHGEVGDWITTEPAPEAKPDQIDEFLSENEEDEEENVPCKKCGRTDLPLHTDLLCPDCHPLKEEGSDTF